MASTDRWGTLCLGKRQIEDALREAWDIGAHGDVGTADMLARERWIVARVRVLELDAEKAPMRDELHCTGCGVTVPAELGYPDRWLHVTGAGLIPIHRCPGCAVDVMTASRYDGFVRIVAAIDQARWEAQ